MLGIKYKLSELSKLNLNRFNNKIIILIYVIFYSVPLICVGLASFGYIIHIYYTDIVTTFNYVVIGIYIFESFTHLL